VWSGISNIFLMVPSAFVKIYSNNQRIDEEESREIDYIILGWIPKAYAFITGARIFFEPAVILIEITFGSDKEHEERVRILEETICKKLRHYRVDCRALLARPCLKDRYGGKSGTDETGYDTTRYICLEKLMNPSTFSGVVMEVFTSSDA